jgi:hypothetical protein
MGGYFFTQWWLSFAFSVATINTQAELVLTKNINLPLNKTNNSTIQQLNKKKNTFVEKSNL